jgi:putative tryptophan/tyrosine transport system substrate-binding protein
VCEWSEMAQDGCLLAYGANRTELRRRVSDYVARIFRGATPREMPIEQPTVFELSVNLKTARTLGLDLPPAFLARADEVIE